MENIERKIEEFLDDMPYHVGSGKSYRELMKEAVQFGQSIGSTTLTMEEQNKILLEELRRKKEADMNLRKKFWMDAWLSVANASNSQTRETCTKWADYALAEFDKRF